MRRQLREIWPFLVALPPSILLAGWLVHVGWSQIAASLYASLGTGAIAWYFASKLRTREQERHDQQHDQ